MADDSDFAFTPPSQPNAYGPSTKSARDDMSELDQGVISTGRTQANREMLQENQQRGGKPRQIASDDGNV